MAERGVAVGDFRSSRSEQFHPQSLGVEICPRTRQTHSHTFREAKLSFLNPTNHSWRIDETYIEIRGAWRYLYRAVDSEGNTLDFMLSAKRDGKAAARFFCKVLRAKHTQTPRVITVDKNAAYPIAMDELKQDQTLKAETELRQRKDLNNLIEQDHRNIKRIVRPMIGFQSFNTARRTLREIEAMAMIRKGQVKGISRGDSVSQIEFIQELFGVSA